MMRTFRSDSVLRLLALAVVVLLPAATRAQRPAAESPQTSFVGIMRSGTLILVVPESRDAVVGYSMETGKWQRQPITPAENEPIVPVASFNVAALRVGNRVLAFSGLVGLWDSVAISADADQEPVVDAFTASVRDGSKFHVFSAKTGQWAGIDLKTGKSVD